MGIVLRALPVFVFSPFRTCEFTLRQWRSKLNSHKKKKPLLQVRRQVPEQLHWCAYATSLILDLDEQEKYPCYIKDYFKLQVKSPNHS